MMVEMGTNTVTGIIGGTDAVIDDAEISEDRTDQFDDGRRQVTCQ